MTGRVDNRHGLTPYLSGIVAGVWILLAWLSPENTYHLAPILIALLFPVGLRLRLGRLPLTTAVGAGVVGMANVLMTTGLLAWWDRLRGSSLLWFGGPALEAIVLGGAGAIIGTIAAYWPLPERRRV